MSSLQYIAKLKCENAGVPKCALRKITFRCFCIWLFLKFTNRTHFCIFTWNNVSIFFTWICWFNTHKSNVCIILLNKLFKFSNSFIICIIHIWIYRTNNNTFIVTKPLHILKICSSQDNRWKSISSAWFNTNRYLIA